MALAAKQVITICLTGLVLVIWFIVRGILGIWHYSKRQNVSVIKWMCQVFGESCKITLVVHMTSSYTRMIKKFEFKKGVGIDLYNKK